MKKILLVGMILCSSLFAQLKWANSYSAALAQAKKEGKGVMVMISREECPSCEYMEGVVLEDKVVIAEIQKRFVPVHLDIHNDFIPSNLSYIGTPTFYFLDSNGKKKERQDGAANIPNFMNIIQKIK